MQGTQGSASALRTLIRWVLRLDDEQRRALASLLESTPEREENDADGRETET